MTIASVAVASVPPRPYAAGPGSAPAERGPTRKMPPTSTYAIEPPPAPIVSTSTIGIIAHVRPGLAGVVGGIWAGRQAGYANVITLDVGGTSADIGLAQEGRLRMKHLLDTKVGPYQAMIPMVDVDTIGAGGGSIAYVDVGGIFRVGPRSAGADPGLLPHTGAAAPRPRPPTQWSTSGGSRLRTFLGGRNGATRRPRPHRLRTRAGKHLGMSVEEASYGAVQILDDSMVQSIEENSVRKGYDPRDFALVAEGGAGPLFAAQIALEVGTPWVIVPRYPGVNKAAMACSPPTWSTSTARPSYQRLVEARRVGAPACVRGARGTGRPQLEEDGLSSDRIAAPAHRRLPLSGPGLRAPGRRRLRPIDHDWIEKVRADFHDIHEREYSRRFEESDIEIPNVRVRGIGLMPDARRSRRSSTARVPGAGAHETSATPGSG